MRFSKKSLKYLALAATAASALTIMAGCSNGSANSADSGKKVQIEFWYGLGSGAGKQMQEMITDFNKSQNQVLVKGVQQADYPTTWQKVQAGLAAHTAPAVFLAQSNTIQAFGGPKGVLRDLTPMVNETNFNKSDFLPVFTKDDQINGDTYAVPAYGTTQIEYYNEKVLKKAGIDPKMAYSTWQNLAAASKQMKEKAGVPNGHMIMWGPDNLTDMALSNGGQFLKDGGKKVDINSKAWIQAWQFARQQLFDTKNMSTISGGQGWTYWYKTIDTVMHNQAGSYTGSSGDRANLDFSFINALPQPGFNNNPAKPQAQALNMAIPKSATDAQAKAAFKWIEYFTNKERQATWSEKIGYVPVRKSVSDDAAYKKFVTVNPYANVAFEQAQNASPEFIDPTGGKILAALQKAADEVEIQNIPAKKALDEAAKVAQQALDQALASK